MSEQMTSPLLLVNNCESSVFLCILRRKSVFESRLHRVYMQRRGTSTYAVYVVFSHFCCVAAFGVQVYFLK